MLDHWRRRLEEESLMKTLTVEGNRHCHSSGTKAGRKQKYYMQIFLSSYPPLL